MGTGRSRLRRSNWALRIVAAILSALAFIGFWQAASGAPRVTPAPTPTPGEYGPPATGSSGVQLPGSFGSPHGGTHVS
jgi:hypothetical protein